MLAYTATAATVRQRHRTRSLFVVQVFSDQHCLRDVYVAMYALSLDFHVALRIQ